MSRLRCARIADFFAHFGLKEHGVCGVPTRHQIATVKNQNRSIPIFYKLVLLCHAYTTKYLLYLEEFVLSVPLVMSNSLQP